jgi:hypothetical protein
MMKDDPTIQAVRDARRRISAMVGHDPRKLVEYYRRLQERHSDRLAAQPPQRPETEGENAV